MAFKNVCVTDVTDVTVGLFSWHLIADDLWELEDTW